MKTKVLLLPLVFVALSCGEPSREQIRERIDQSILSYVNNWLSLKKETMYEVNTTDFKLLKDGNLPSSAKSDSLSEDQDFYYTTTIITKTVDNLVAQDTIHCTLDKSFNIVYSTYLPTNEP